MSRITKISKAAASPLGGIAGAPAPCGAPATSRNYLEGYGSTEADQRFALMAALVAGAWFFGGLILCKMVGWL